MIKFTLNGKNIVFKGDKNTSLLNYLRLEQGIISVKDGCSAQAACGACMVEVNGKARLSCTTIIKNLESAEITTMEGVPEAIKTILAKAFVEKGAVQCGFCTPGFLMRTKVLLQENPTPSKEDIKKALTLNLCRCTGYVKIIEAIEAAAKAINNKESVEYTQLSGKVGTAYPKYKAFETAIGKRLFVNDITVEGLLHAVLRFSDYPRAKILKIDFSKAEKMQGVLKVFTAKDIPGDKMVGVIIQDWPLMLAEGEITHYIGDVLAGVVAETEAIAREAAKLIEIKYEVLAPVTDPFEAIKEGAEKVHTAYPNLWDNCIVNRGGDADDVLKKSAFISKGIYKTQRIEHAFLECEGAVALPDGDGLQLYVNSQGVYVDRKQVAKILNLPEEKVKVTLIPSGGGFGGKEDMTVQGHVSLFAYLLKKPVKLVLSREESITMHPKRHPVTMDITVGCDNNGKLTAIKMYAVGDSGAYASVGAKVMERVAGHAAGGYYFPCVNLQALTVYTNNIPSGAMRGFGVNQSVFALESCMDDLCEQGGFNRWQMRYDNALDIGSMTATGQIMEQGVGVKATLLAVKEHFYKAKYAGIATGIKNCGVGNGMPDFSNIKIEIISPTKVLIDHGWTEMGQGVHNVAIQTLCEETGINPEFIDVKVETAVNIPTGMTTSSRATVLVGNAVIETAKQIKEDLKTKSLTELVGKVYKGGWVCDWTTKPGADVDKIVTHFSYGYATQLVTLDDDGNIKTIYAAHDAGKIMNPTMFEGQIEGAVHMGLGYALSEDLPMKDGFLISKKLKDLQIIKLKDIPNIVVIGVEVKEPSGPYGAKGLGEIGLVPTAGAVANALYQFDKIRRYELPLKRKPLK